MGNKSEAKPNHKKRELGQAATCSTRMWPISVHSMLMSKGAYTCPLTHSNASLETFCREVYQGRTKSSDTASSCVGTHWNIVMRRVVVVIFQWE